MTCPTHCVFIEFDLNGGFSLQWPVRSIKENRVNEPSDTKGLASVWKSNQYNPESWYKSDGMFLHGLAFQEKVSFKELPCNFSNLSKKLSKVLVFKVFHPCIVL